MFIALIVIALNAEIFCLKMKFQHLVQNTNFFLEPIIQIQAYTFLSMCSIECDLNNITKESVALTFEKDKKKLNLLFTHKLPCRNCRSNVNAQFKLFKNNPPWVFVQTNDSEIYVQEVPKI